jgi:hypothetical protein
LDKPHDAAKQKEIIMQWFFSATGIVFLLFGAFLALCTKTEEIRHGPPSPPPTTVEVRRVSREHPANWAASEGFAMAGGLCLIAAALVHRTEQSSASIVREWRDRYIVAPSVPEDVE